MKKNIFFYFPLAALLAYTLGSFFLNSTYSEGIYLSPGGSSLLTGTMTSILTVVLLAIAILVLFFSIRKKGRRKNE